GVATPRGGRGERPVASARVADGPARAGAPGRRGARPRNVAGHLPLRVRRPAHAVRVRDRAGLSRPLSISAGAVRRRDDTYRRSGPMPHPVIHAEIRSTDPDATRAFFSDLFGWTYSDGAFPGYTFVDTGAEGALATA